MPLRVGKPSLVDRSLARYAAGMNTLGAAVVSGVICAVVTAVVVWQVARAMRARLAGEVGALRERLLERQGELQSAMGDAERWHEEVVRLRTRAAADEERMRWLEEAQGTLGKRFDELATKALEHTSRTLYEQSERHWEGFSHRLRADWNTQRADLAGIVAPVTGELTKLDAQVRALEEKRSGAYAALHEQIESIGAQYRSLLHATTSLDSALRTPTVRGKWGEVQLRRLVELAGLQEHVDYDQQYTTVNEHSGKTVRPDLIVYLPSGGVMPVDAKVPMAAYLDSLQAESPELVHQALRRHAQALRSHVKELSRKAYWSAFERSPEFVVLVVPYESALSAAFGVDAELLEDALSNHVVIASPTSFLALLQVVAYGWMRHSLSENAQEIARTGRQFIERLGPFVDHLNKVGSAIDSAGARFNAAVGSFERRVVPTARRLQELSSRENHEEASVELRPVEQRPRPLRL